MVIKVPNVHCDGLTLKEIANWFQSVKIVCGVYDNKVHK